MQWNEWLDTRLITSSAPLTKPALILASGTLTTFPITLTTWRISLLAVGEEDPSAIDAYGDTVYVSLWTQISMQHVAGDSGTMT